MQSPPSYTSANGSYNIPLMSSFDRREPYKRDEDEVERHSHSNKRSIGDLLEQGGRVSLPPLDFSKKPMTSDAFANRSPPSTPQWVPQSNNNTTSSSTYSTYTNSYSSQQNQMNYQAAAYTPSYDNYSAPNTAYNNYQQQVPPQNYHYTTGVDRGHQKSSIDLTHTSPQRIAPQHLPPSPPQTSRDLEFNPVHLAVETVMRKGLEGAPLTNGSKDRLSIASDEIIAKVEETFNFTVDRNRKRKSSNASHDPFIQRIQINSYLKGIKGGIPDPVDSYVAEISSQVYQTVFNHLDLLKGADKKIRCPFGHECNRTVKGKGNFRKHLEWHLRKIEDDAKRRLEIVKYESLAEASAAAAASSSSAKESAPPSPPAFHSSPEISIATPSSSSAMYSSAPRIIPSSETGYAKRNDIPPQQLQQDGSLRFIEYQPKVSANRKVVLEEKLV